MAPSRPYDGGHGAGDGPPALSGWRTRERRRSTRRTPRYGDRSDLLRRCGLRLFQKLPGRSGVTAPCGTAQETLLSTQSVRRLNADGSSSTQRRRKKRKKKKLPRTSSFSRTRCSHMKIWTSSSSPLPASSCSASRLRSTKLGFCCLVRQWIQVHALVLEAFWKNSIHFLCEGVPALRCAMPGSFFASAPGYFWTYLLREGRTRILKSILSCPRKWPRSSSTSPVVCACWLAGHVTPLAVFPSIVGRLGTWRSVHGRFQLRYLP